jgi:hypothetical protein
MFDAVIMEHLGSVRCTAYISVDAGSGGRSVGLVLSLTKATELVGSWTVMAVMVWLELQVRLQRANCTSLEHRISSG